MKSAAVTDLFLWTCRFIDGSRAWVKSIVKHQTSVVPNMECVYSCLENWGSIVYAQNVPVLQYWIVLEILVGENLGFWLTLQWCSLLFHVLVYNNQFTTAFVPPVCPAVIKVVHTIQLTNVCHSLVHPMTFSLLSLSLSLSLCYPSGSARLLWGEHPCPPGASWQEPTSCWQIGACLSETGERACFQD